MMPTGDRQPKSPQQEAKPPSPGDETQRSQWGCKWSMGRRKRALLFFVSGVLVILIIITLALGSGVWHKQCSPRPHFSHVCPNDTISFQGKCYYFSDTEGDWNSSREHCQHLGASLATVDTEEEMKLMLRYQGQRDHWIGLHRAGGDEPWTWADGSAFNNWFKPHGRGRCAYLNGMGISSAHCNTEKLWVCSRADSYVLWRNGTHPQ